MYNNQFERNTIAIESITVKDSQVFVKAGSGEIYSFFKTKKDDGSATNAAVTLRPFKAGDTVVVTFKVNGKYNNATGFYVPDEKSPSPSPSRQIQPSQSTYHSPDSQGSLGARLQLEGKVNGLLAAGMKPEDISLDVLSKCQTLEKRIIFTLTLAETPEPTPEPTQEVNVENIPF